MVQTLTAIARINAVSIVDTLHPVVSTTPSLLDNGKGKNQGCSENHPSSSGSHTPDLAPGKISCISWTFSEHVDQTTCLITYCKDNNDFCLKIFSNSTEDANQQGRSRHQLTISRDQAYQTLVRAVFEHDRDPELKQAVTTHPTLFVATIKQRFNMYIHTLFFMI